MQRFFRVTLPAVYQMLLTLEQAGLISRSSGAARAIVFEVDRKQLSAPQPGYRQTIKSTVQNYRVISENG